MAGPNPFPLPRERNLILGVLLGLSALCWGLVAWQSLSLSTASMGSPMGAPTGLTMGMSAALFLAIWIAMMVAMMFPSSVPMVLMFHAISAGRRQRARVYTPTWVFVSGYLLVWTLAGVVAYALATGLDRLASQSIWLTGNASRIGGVVLIAAGLYQLSPLKHTCLAKCRTPLQFVMTSWREGTGGAVRMGIEHGAHCLGCCWLLFVILFPLGMMNIAALVLLTALIFAEKVLPVGRTVSAITGVALVVYGAVIVFIPALLPAIRLSFHLTGTASLL
jgi:predicted metal-binding membrane protein